MREISFGDQKVKVRATPIALLHYKQEFKRSIMGDIISLQKMQEDASNFDEMIFLQIAWAMAKADAFGKGTFPTFMDWLASFESVDVTDQDLIKDILEEAGNGFFRSKSKEFAKSLK